MTSAGIDYGVVIYDDGKHKHQRYFCDIVDTGDNVVEVMLLTGDWIGVQRKMIVKQLNSQKKEETEK